MGIPVGTALAFGMQLFQGIRNAIEAGRTEVSEEDIDTAMDELEASDDRLTGAIERARAREQGGG